MGLFSNPLEQKDKFSDTRKYIDDFNMVEETDARGRIHRRAVYRGTWYVLQGSAAKLRVWAALGLSVMILAAYGWMLYSARLRNLLVGLPVLVGLFPCLYLAMGAFSLPFRGRPMRRDQYMHSVIRMSRSSVAIMVCAGLGLAVCLILRIVNADWLFQQSDWLLLALLSADTVLPAALLVLLRNIDITERENAAYNPDASRSEKYKK